ncbi:arginine--tRNA ligase [Akkermansiaceae bacterium]|nr:arginine--tRNA ligase [Akkermansiaceae bacterium]
MTFISLFEKHLDDAVRSLKIELPENFAIQVTISQDLRFGDYQANTAMVLAKRLKCNPRDLATDIITALPLDGIAECDIAGPGFINFRLTNQAWSRKVSETLSDVRLGVELTASPRNIIVDFSSPNIAKPMHVGHIRSTIIGDSITRVAKFLGHQVISDNHIGDWGTQFGKVIYGWKNLLNDAALEADPLAELLRLYKTVHELTESDKDLEQQCRDELVKLQQGDEENLKIWEICIELSKQGLQLIYNRLDVSFDHWLGESYYNDQLADTVDKLIKSGNARESEGAICIFSSGETPEKQDPFRVNRDGEWQDLPMIVRKKDGGYNYATTDLATVDYRVNEWSAEEILYVVDARQSAHFKQLFDISKRNGVTAKMEHVSFGTINGKDGKPLKTREGDLPQLADILNDAVTTAAEVLKEKSGHLPENEQKELAETIGIGSVKFTELSHHRASDYIFDLEKMVALQGDTAPYLQYSYVRVKSIFQKLDSLPDFSTLDIQVTEEAEQHLIRMISRYGEVLPTVLEGYKPNALATYLIELARAFHSFFEACPVLKSEGATQQTRIALCELTARVLQHGLSLLGIKAPERM